MQINVVILLFLCNQLLFTTASFARVKVPESAKQPNVLIILADDLGWGDLSFHGSHQIPTPNIDLLASSGVILNNYYVSPICSPSRSALLTGYYPIHTGMQEGVIAASTPYGLPLHFSTIAQRFKEIGYATHLSGKWHQGMFAWNYLPTRRGFDSYLGYLTGHSDYYNRTGGDVAHGYDFRENEKRANLSKYEGKYSTDLYADRVVSLIEEHAAANGSAKPFLIYFAEQSVHGGTFEAVQPPDRYRDKFTWIKDRKRRNFAGMVAALDESIGKVFRALNETGQLDNTIIFFSNDNGGASGNGRGSFIDHSIGSNYPLKGAKYTLWEGGVRGTSFIWTSQLKRPYISNHLIHLVDVLPTLFAAAGGDVSHLGPIDGMNLWPALMNQSTEPVQHHLHPVRDYLLHNIDHTQKSWAIRYQNYKLTSGTWDQGHWDVWWSAPGQLNESTTICYECSDVYKVLKHRNAAPVHPVTVKVDCRREQQSMTPCNAAGQKNDRDFCLFDLEADPCELSNIADKNPAVVKKLFALYASYNVTYAKPENKPLDVMANPKYHGGWWTPWK